MFEHFTVKVVNGVKAIQVEWYGLPIVKYAELANGDVRLLWVIDHGHQVNNAAEMAVSEVLESLVSRIPAYV